MNTVLDLPRFYFPEAGEDKEWTLDADENKHVKVLRLQTGDMVHVIDGRGGLWSASINPDKRHSTIRVGECLVQETDDDRKLTLAVAPTKNMGRFEWVIEKAVELGVKEIIPIQCEHSERVHLKTDRLNRIALSAMKQSKGLWLPVIHELTPFQDALDHQVDLKWIAHCLESKPRVAIDQLNSGRNQIVCIGPEGDFSETEVHLAETAGFQSISLGNRRLRTETAAIAACIASNLFAS